MKSNDAVLVIGIGTQIGLSIIRSLGRKGIRVYGVSNSSKDLGRYSRFLKEWFILSASLPEDDYISTLIRLANKNAINYLITIDEKKMILLNKHRTQLEKQFILLFPKEETLAKVIDKQMTIAVAENLNIPVPKTVAVLEKDDIQKCSSLRFPIILKSQNKNIPNGFQRKLRSQVEYFENYSVLRERLEQIVRDGELGAILAQEYSSGRETCLCVLLRDRKCVASHQYDVLRSSPLQGGPSVYRKSVAIMPVLEDRAVSLLKALSWDGIAQLDFIYDNHLKDYLLLEINGRFWGALSLALYAGIDFPYLLYKTAKGQELTEVVKHKTGVMSRLLGGDTNWMLEALKVRKSSLSRFFKIVNYSKKKIIFEYVKSFNINTKYDVHVWDDPLPGLVDAMFMAKKIFIR
jgi:predicted ATP-grasp superfamily ATP-dependent carboligase